MLWTGSKGSNCPDLCDFATLALWQEDICIMLVFLGIVGEGAHKPEWGARHNPVMRWTPTLTVLNADVWCKCHPNPYGISNFNISWSPFSHYRFVMKGEWINEFDCRNPSVLKTKLVKNILAAINSPCINPLRKRCTKPHVSQGSSIYLDIGTGLPKRNLCQKWICAVL